MVLQRARPPLLETPFEVFDQGIFTPNDRFYVRWHLANIPHSHDGEVMIAYAMNGMPLPLLNGRCG